MYLFTILRLSVGCIKQMTNHINHVFCDLSKKVVLKKIYNPISACRLYFNLFVYIMLSLKCSFLTIMYLWTYVTCAWKYYQWWLVRYMSKEFPLNNTLKQYLIILLRVCLTPCWNIGYISIIFFWRDPISNISDVTPCCNFQRVSIFSFNFDANPCLNFWALTVCLISLPSAL